MKNRARVQHLAGQLALFRRPLHRRQQRGQRGAILRPGVLLQSPTQRQMLNFPLLGNAMGVGGQKSKGIRRVALVLRQMKSDASDRVPDRVAASQIRHRPTRGVGDAGMNMSVQLVP